MTRKSSEKSLCLGYLRGRKTLQSPDLFGIFEGEEDPPDLQNKVLRELLNSFLKKSRQRVPNGSSVIFQESNKTQDSQNMNMNHPHPQFFTSLQKLGSAGEG